MVICCRRHACGCGCGCADQCVRTKSHRHAGRANALLSLLFSVICNAAGASLEPLLEEPPAGLKGLSVTGWALKQERFEQLAGLTNLTSLHLVRATSSLVDVLLTNQHVAVLALATCWAGSCLTPIIRCT